MCTNMRVIFTILGLLFVGIGAIGVIIPVMPTTPFLIAAAIFLAKGSGKFNDWFTGTKLYKNNLENFVKTGGMTAKQKKKNFGASITYAHYSFVYMSRPHRKGSNSRGDSGQILCVSV